MRAQQSIHAAENLNDDQRLIGARKVEHLVGVSCWTIWRLEAAGAALQKLVNL
jgi:predicted DNA-binding transcriptional regulator AlpA